MKDTSMLELVFKFFSSDKQVKIKEDKNGAFICRKKNVCSLSRVICIIEKCIDTCLDPLPLFENLRIYNLEHMWQISWKYLEKYLVKYMRNGIIHK